MINSKTYLLKSRIKLFYVMFLINLAKKCSFFNMNFYNLFCSSFVVDKNLYQKFWSLQDYFRSPNTCYNKMQWRQFTSVSITKKNSYKFKYFFLELVFFSHCIFSQQQLINKKKVKYFIFVLNDVKYLILLKI